MNLYVYSPKDNVKIATTEEEAKQQQTDSSSTSLSTSYLGTDIDHVCNQIIK